MGKIKDLFLHHSFSNYGDVMAINQWHLTRGFKMIGYHWVILNGIPFNDMINGFNFLDGQICPGRPVNDDPLLDEDEVGAHTYGRNRDSLAVCMVGNGKFTSNQWLSLRYLFHGLHQSGIKVRLWGHYEKALSGHTTKCPGVDMDVVRAFIALEMHKSIKFMFEDPMSNYILSGVA